MSYAESIVKEVKLRLNIRDEEVKGVFVKYEHIEKGDINRKNCGNVSAILEEIFEQEPGEVSSFRITYLPLLNLPEEIKQDVNKGNITKSAACEVAKIKDKENQKKVAKNVNRFENIERKNFLPSEIIAIAESVRPIEEKKAKERQIEHKGTAPGKQVNHLRKVSSSDEKKREKQTRDKVAEYAGISGKTLEKIEKVVEAAKKEPEKYEILVKETMARR